MICKNCQKEVMDEAYFCPYCGEKLREYELEVPLDNEPLKQETVEGVQATETSKNNHAQTEAKPRNDMAIIGFVGSFVSPILGAALGAIGLARSLKKNGAGKGFSIAAICIAAVSFVLNATFNACTLLLGY